MEQPKQNRGIHIGLVVGLSALILGSGGGTAWWMLRSMQAPNTSSSILEEVQPTPSEQNTPQAYWIKDTGNALELVSTPVQIKSLGSSQEQLTLALKTVLESPVDPEVSSTIPLGTTLLSLEEKSDGIHLNLSQEFTTGGGSASMTGRLGQILYTATSLDPDAPVWLSVEGEPLEYLGGEGLEIPQPMTRDLYDQEFAL
ncbi:GerMN domain-containing protein [Roseofilum sp. BLCC_M154]|uniref:GerMN domain-containing protein n=1 Tax=Roseofilum acuticapitatum BLCC-M154 TaxID=3022444 RepID=A0ABT7AXP1_9CYAN|nr:GerMN domain-containing protein [Roseofilum acuticapitatum]MDJ1171352.1 GerMN domain-containing protein [Roseofilum acuticapitatum BLCC-M154]